MTTNAPADLALLTGETAGELMTALLATAGATPLGRSLRHVDHQPGVRTTVAYAARVRWADGSETREQFGASSGKLPEGVAVLDDGRSRVGMWRVPFDPDLPALAAAHDPARAGRLAAGLGLGDGPARVHLVAYRPRRRAVVRISGSGGTFFAKIVRPGRAEALHERHRLLSEAGCPVPAPLGWNADGLVALGALPGRTLRRHLLDASADAVDPAEVLAVLDALPASIAGGAPQRTWGQRAPFYASLIAASCPELGERAHRIASAVDHRAPEGPAVPVHGDFYESQLILDGPTVTGLLDVDTAGTGERLDDAGCLLGHLAVLSGLHPAAATTIDGLAAGLRARLAAGLDPAALARRTAAVVLSLATGPARVRTPDWRAATQDRIALAERCLGSTQKLSTMDSAVA
ncbi:aminoglycoside phosphotransferase [Amycolatopsis antarctica]|uniref:Aminoglycoside phosphotransferase n=1 Tax=Amycolatopsis antarctica TaxID=1854586 RepID=A0A263D5D3_9PSEU|nr:aminoglycoside phosphotransferase family protein [Amycolatopsis antarctica]OZM73714.1 aminoglycoside phosphotransferase [Amycolatopsis antarctica]